MIVRLADLLSVLAHHTLDALTSQAGSLVVQVLLAVAGMGE